MSTSVLTSALALAALPFLKPVYGFKQGLLNANELANNLAGSLTDKLNKGAVESIVDKAILDREVPRSGGWMLDGRVDREGLIGVLVEISLEWWSEQSEGNDEEAEPTSCRESSQMVFA